MCLCENNIMKSDDIITLPNTVELKNESDFISLLDIAIRRTKSHKYFNNNDLTVCLFLDSDSINTHQIGDTIKELYKLLNKAYYNRVCVDIYFLLLEEFTLCSKTKSKNEVAKNMLSEFSKQDWVRYIYLLSDVNNKGQLITDRNELFQLMLDSAFLTNCLVNNENINRLQDILIRESESSKYFCIGQVALCPSEQGMKQMVRAELLQKLLKDDIVNSDSPEMPSFLKFLCDDIQNELFGKALEIPPDSSATVPISVSSLTNFDYLYLFFKNKPMQKMDQIELECKEEFLNKADYYFQQANIWINDLLDQFNMNFWTSQYEGFVTTTVMYFINQYQSQIYAECKLAHEEYISWKNQKITVKRKIKRAKRQELASQLLEQWRGFQVKERVYSVLDECIAEICYRIKLWHEDIMKKCRLFSELQIDSDYRWRVLLQNSTQTQKLLLKYERKIFSEYLMQNPWKVNKCRQQLNSLLRNEISSEAIENTIAPFIEQLFWEVRQFLLLWQNFDQVSGLKNTQIKELYMKLYHVTETDILLNTRRNIFNTEPYLCFYGIFCKQLIRYIQGQNESDYILCFENPSTLAKVFYVQNLPSSSTFFWKEDTSEIEAK